jgi:glycerate dehydrogenase
MKIVILDGYTLYDKDKMQETYSPLGDVTCYDRTAPNEVFERICNADAVLTNKVIISNEVMEKCPKLTYIGVLATGYNVVDTAYAALHNIVVTNVPAYSTMSVVQLVFAFVLAFACKVEPHNSAVQRGEWVNCPDFMFLKSPLSEIAGKTMGIIGMGTIGTQVAKIASAFGMNIVCASRSKKELPIPGLVWADTDDVFEQADYLTLHAPLTEKTRGIVNWQTLNKMKPTAYLINTARGPLVNDADLAEALNQNRIAGAAVDVMTSEPPKADNPLLTAKNMLITPHLGWASTEAKQRLLKISYDNLEAFQKGNTVNQVN